MYDKMMLEFIETLRNKRNEIADKLSSFSDRGVPYYNYLDGKKDMIDEIIGYLDSLTTKHIINNE